MKLETGIIIYQENQTETTEVSFLDILLDESLVCGTVYIPKTCLQKVSFLNRRLSGKREYELLLRLAQEFPVRLSGNVPENAEGCVVMDARMAETDLLGLRADCYIIARYKKRLLDIQLFDSAVGSILDQAEILGCQEEIVTFLSGMLQENADYQYLYQGSQPFLIYTGNGICYNILSVFAEELGLALRKLGCLVEYFDLSKEDFTESFRFIGRSYQAVIGVQSYMFSVRLNEGQGFLHDKISGPKYNFVLDHPVSFEQHLKEVPGNLTIFTPDRAYAEFARKNYPVNACFFPPGGIVREFTEKKRIYNIAFIGSYYDNSEEIRDALQKMDRNERFLVNRLWLMMRRYPKLASEELLAMTLEYYDYHISEEEFLNLLHGVRKFVVFMMYRYRLKILKTLMEAGIKVDVFGASWRESPLCRNANFIWHSEDLTTEECLVVWQQSKIALNVMSWHKDAVTERILNSMLQKAVVLTERNPYMEEAFEEGEEVVLYSLDRLEQLPELVTSLLSDEARLSDIAERGCRKALTAHTWDCRAEELLEILDRGMP